MSKHYYVTTPIYYLSGTPHIGTGYTSISVDVLARFKRLDGYDVKFLTGTDEHGLKVFQCAQKQDKEPQQYCDDEAQKFKALGPLLNLSNDDFIRTTEERHRKSAQAFWQKLEEKGYIYKDSYSGWYAVSDEAYYDEKEITTNDAGEKIAIESGSKVQWMEEESYFFKLSAFEDKLLAYFQEEGRVEPKSRRNEVISFVKSGLRDLSISRTTFSWGIPVPGDEKHVMYVWIDALTNYLSALGYPEQTPDMDNFWHNAIHLMGKDILRFHAVYWPAFLMAADLPLPKTIFAHGWLLIDGEKMSKSKGNVVLPSDLVDRFGLDQTRYFLMRDVPFGNDGSFSIETIANRVNADLANNFGNLCQRVLSMIFKNCDGCIPEYTLTDADQKLLDLSGNVLLEKCRTAIDQQKIHEYLEVFRSVSSEANTYMDEQAPWGLKKTDPERMGTVLYVLAEVIRRLAVIVQPAMPESAQKVLAQLGQTNFSFKTLSDTPFLTPGLIIEKPEGVFPRYVEEEKEGAA